MKSFIFLLPFFLVTTVYAQHGNPKDDPYKGCCSTKPVDFDTGEGSIFVPNAFTPNRDGINDFFLPFADDNSVEIQDFTITTPNGTEPLFFREKVDLNRPTESWWTGETEDKTLYEGLFEYSFVVFKKNGKKKTIKGEACAVRCGENSIQLKNNKNCFYPAQGANGKSKKDWPSTEKDCFN